MKKSRNDVVLIELMPGGKGESVDTTKLPIWRVLDELFDCTDRVRLRGSSQSVEESVGLARESHGKIGLMILHLSCGEGNGKQVTDMMVLQSPSKFARTSSRR